MSWDKNTIVHSEIDAIISIFEEIHYPYKLKILGEVMGCGLNDDDGQIYSIRSLEYKTKKGYNIVLLERMERTSDCDGDDYIVVHKFNKKDVPKNWKLEITDDA
jgi:hypothetical protein